VTLPIPANAANAVEPTAPTIDGQSTPIPAHKILVVDDVQASARTLALMLQSIGQTVSIVHDGPAAIDWVREHRPDLVFLDIAMPGMSGYEVARRIRKQAELRESYLVALTGYGQEADRLRALEAGFDCHMTKPTSIDALRRLLTDRAAEQQGDHATASAAK
jgi:CheY-like chemotaxis protein